MDYVKIKRVGALCGLFQKRVEPGYVLENGAVLLESERDETGYYIGGAGMDGMYLATAERYLPVYNVIGEIMVFQRIDSGSIANQLDAKVRRQEIEREEGESATKKKGSKKFIYPDWSKTAGQIVTRGDEKGTEQRPVWRPYDWDSADDTKVLHFLRVTLEVAGGSYPFGEKFASEEEREAVGRESDRRVTWLRALGFAEQMWRDEPHREYVVLFRPVSQDNGRETICIY